MPGDDAARAPHVGAADRRIGLWHLAPLPVVGHGRNFDAEVRSYVGGRPPLRGCVRASSHGHHSGINGPVLTEVRYRRWLGNPREACVAFYGTKGGARAGRWRGRAAAAVAED